MHRWFTEVLNTTQDEEQEGKVRLKMKGCFFSLNLYKIFGKRRQTRRCYMTNFNTALIIFCHKVSVLNQTPVGSLEELKISSDQMLSD